MSEPSALLPPLKPRQANAKLWKDGRFVEDLWRRVSDDEPVAGSATAIVTLARWTREKSALTGTIGIALAVGDTIDPSATRLERVALVALPFAKFSDGRSYSAARRLREAGFQGEIRATGDVLLDQLPLMLRTGFSTFEITHAATLEALERGELPALAQTYQAGAEVSASASLFKTRRQGAVQ